MAAQANTLAHNIRVAQAQAQLQAQAEGLAAAVDARPLQIRPQEYLIGAGMQPPPLVMMRRCSVDAGNQEAAAGSVGFGSSAISMRQARPKGMMNRGVGDGGEARPMNRGVGEGGEARPVGASSRGRHPQRVASVSALRAAPPPAQYSIYTL